MDDFKSEEDRRLEEIVANLRKNREKQLQDKLDEVAVASDSYSPQEEESSLYSKVSEAASATKEKITTAYQNEKVQTAIEKTKEKSKGAGKYISGKAKNTASYVRGLFQKKDTKDEEEKD